MALLWSELPAPSNDKELPVQTIEILKKGAWKTFKKKLSTPRGGPCAAVMTAGAKAGQVLIVGGTNAPGETEPEVASADLYNPAAGTVTATNNRMNVVRGFPDCTALNDGTVLVSGGIANSRLAYDTAEIYHPDTDSFTFTNNNMSDFRVGHSATLLNDGTVLIAGGDRGFTGPYVPLDSADLYDPTTGKFTALPTMNDVRDWSGVTLIAGSGTSLDGQVLIAGGYLPGNLTLDTAELYDPVKQTFTATNTMNFFHAEPNAAVIP